MSDAIATDASSPPAGDGVSVLDWVERFEAQASACEALGSDLYARLLRVVAAEIDAGGASRELIMSAGDLRFGQAGPLRLAGAAHRLALSGVAPQWAAVLPSTGGTVPDDDALRHAWRELVDSHGSELRAGLRREVQTNEVGRAAGLALALARTGYDQCTLIELGCSGGLNLRLDRFRSDLGDVVLGDPGSPLVLSPEMRTPVHGALSMPTILARVGIDPNPIDATTDDGRWTLSSFVWPDQRERFGRLTAALDIAGEHPVTLTRTDDTAEALRAALDVDGPRVVQHSIVWQYIPTAMRWRITDVMEAAGRDATSAAPLAWSRYEPDEWNRSRAAIWLRTWPGGADRLVAHVDFHGRWLQPVPTG